MRAIAEIARESNGSIYMTRASDSRAISAIARMCHPCCVAKRPALR